MPNKQQLMQKNCLLSKVYKSAPDLTDNARFAQNPPLSQDCLRPETDNKKYLSQSSQRKALCFVGWALPPVAGRQLAAACRAMPDLRRYKLNCFLCELCGSARVNFLKFLRSAKAQQQPSDFRHPLSGQVGTNAH